MINVCLTFRLPFWMTRKFSLEMRYPFINKSLSIQSWIILSSVYKNIWDRNGANKLRSQNFRSIKKNDIYSQINASGPTIAINIYAIIRIECAFSLSSDICFQKTDIPRMILAILNIFTSFLACGLLCDGINIVKVIWLETIHWLIVVNIYPLSPLWIFQIYVALWNFYSFYLLIILSTMILLAGLCYQAL